MKTEMGEYIVGAYLKLELDCHFVDYNVRSSSGGLAGLSELDVVGLNFTNKTAYICEVTTHIQGLLYGSGNKETIEKIRSKHQRQIDYANQYLTDFPKKHFMFWSPVVPKGLLTKALGEIETLELVINETYTECVDALRKRAKETTHDIGNPFFRTLQILEHLRR